MKLAFLLIALLISIGYAQKCTTPEVVDGFCGNKESCCTKEEQSSFALSLSLLLSRDAPQVCFDVLASGLCGTCSPNPYHFKNESLITCQSFCNRFYDACKGVKDINGQFIIPENQTKENCKDLPTTTCYDAAGLKVIAFSAVIFVALVAVMMF